MDIKKDRKKREIHEGDEYDIAENARDKYHAAFALRFNRILIEKQLTQSKVSEDLEISPGNISNYRNGITMPDSRNLVRICQYFNVSADYLLGISDVRTPRLDMALLHKRTGLTEHAVINLMLMNIRNSVDKDNAFLLDSSYILNELENPHKQDQFAISALNTVLSSKSSQEFWKTMAMLLADNIDYKDGEAYVLADGVPMKINADLLVKGLFPKLQQIIEEIKSHKEDEYKVNYFGMDEKTEAIIKFLLKDDNSDLAPLDKRQGEI